MSDISELLPSNRHISVLYQEFLEYFPISQEQQNVVVDATLGM